MRGLYKLPASYDTHTRERAERSFLQITVWGAGGLFSSPQESMIKVGSTLEKVKKRRLARNRKPSDIFRMFNLSETFKAKEHQTREFLAAAPQKFEKKKKKPFDKQKYEDVYRRIREAWPRETAAKLRKKDRRKLYSQFAPLEWNIFCRWCKICRRNSTHVKHNQKRKRRSKYEIFIGSPLWESRKNVYYQNNPRRCAACDSPKHIHLHHMVYGEFGKEPDEHLIPLCKTHHEGFHAKNGTQRHMIRATMEYIKSVKACV